MFIELTECGNVDTEVQTYQYYYFLEVKLVYSF